MRWLLSLFLLMVPMVARAITLDEMLAKVDANMTFDTRETTITMKVIKNGREKVYKMHSYGRGQDEGATEYLEPARDKGTKMLKKGDELWMWLPSVEKTQKISGHMLRQSMMGSDLSYEDMMQASAWRKAYSGAVVGEEVVEGRKTWKIDMKANDATVSYPRRLVWVDQETYIPVRQELYALSGMLLKVWSMSDVKAYGDRQFPSRMVIEDKVQQGSRTELTFDAIAFHVPLQEEVFSLRWLER
ncbi:MAG: outer membrane lipoprotein-sorting protein [Myxococcota bacterium]